MMKKILILSFTLIATGCSMLPNQTRPVEVVTIAEPPPMYHPPLPLELQLVDIDWEIMTPELMEEYLKQLEDGSAPPTAYYSLTSKDYENLSMNMAELKRYLREVLGIVEFYREYDTDPDDEEKTTKD